LSFTEAHSLTEAFLMEWWEKIQQEVLEEKVHQVT
jgi:hypothetical protein